MNIKDLDCALLKIQSDFECIESLSTQSLEKLYGNDDRETIKHHLNQVLACTNDSLNVLHELQSSIKANAKNAFLGSEETCAHRDCNNTFIKTVIWKKYCCDECRIAEYEKRTGYKLIKKPKKRGGGHEL